MLKKYLVIITVLSLAGASSVFAHENERGREGRYDRHREEYEQRVIYHRLPSRFSRVIVRGAPIFTVMAFSINRFMGDLLLWRLQKK